MAHSARRQEPRNRKKWSLIVLGESNCISSEIPLSAQTAQGGKDVPDFDFTSPISAALMAPLAFTSVRKFDPVVVCPDCAFV